MSGEELMTLKEAAKLAKVTPGALSAAIRKGLLDGKKKGRDWFVTKKAIKTWQRNNIHKQGRPKQT